MQNNKDLGKIFKQMADILDIRGANTFRIRAYRRAVEIMESLSEDVSQLRDEGTLTELPGIGSGMAALIGEYLDNGEIAEFGEMKASIPAGVLDLLNISNLGPKKVGQLYKELNLTGIDSLEKAAKQGKIRNLKGMGAKSEENILKGIESFRRRSKRTPLGEALPLAEQIVLKLEKLNEVKQIEIAGSIRRGKETVKDIDILVTASKSEKIMDTFCSLSDVERIIGKGDTKSSIRFRSGIQADLRVVDRNSYGAAMQYFTGSKTHNVMLRGLASKKGLKINEYGVFRTSNDRKVAGTTEASVYKALGLEFIHPTMREGFDEIERAQDHTLPNPIEISDIAGDLHTHTDWSEGKNSIGEMVKAAKRKGYKYLAITDHSESSHIANGLSQDRLEKQMDAIDEIDAKIKGIKVLKGIELDIRTDGKLDFPDNLLQKLDLVVISIHTNLAQNEKEMTKRICRALKNENTHILAHPTGRIIGKRDPCTFDIDKVMNVAAETGTALELNAHYRRLDLNDLLLKRAKGAGVTIGINSDAHSTTGLDQMRYGIMTAQRAGLEKKNVLNAGGLTTLRKFLRKR